MAACVGWEGSTFARLFTIAIRLLSTNKISDQGFLQFVR
jgi:hypothetical protein